MGLKNGGLRSGGLRNLSKSKAVPGSVEYQVRVEEFASPWPFNIGGIDMTVNGLSASTFSNGEDSVSSDGTDDYGLAASGPETYISKQTFGLAFSFSASSISSFVNFFGNFSDPQYFQIASGVDTNGAIELNLADDNDNRLRVGTDSSYDDGSPHAVVINKSGNTGGDVDIYVDDMSNPTSTTTGVDQGFDNTNATGADDLAFHARNNQGSIDTYIAMNSGVFEFNSQTYTESERQGFVSRRPEV